MKFLIVALFVAAAYAVEEKDAEIVQSSYEGEPDGGFKSSFETSNKIYAAESGHLKSVGDKVALTAEGSYGYVDPNGVAHETKYTADEYGYHPEGADLPTPPAPEAIPVYIARALEWIAAHPYVEKAEKI